MAVYSPQTPMPSHVHDKLIAVRASNGLHIEFKDGWPSFPERNNNAADVYLKPAYNGYTFRVFLFATDDTSHVRVGLFYENRKWYSDVEILDTVVYNYYNADYSDNAKSEKFSTPVKAGDYYSLGTRVKGVQLLQGVFNDMVATKEVDMTEPLGDYKYYMNINAGKHVVLSIHISDELHTDFPATGLGKSFHYPFIHTPAGSSYTALCVFTGDSKDVKFIVKYVNGRVEAVYQNANLKKGEEFTVLVRNTPTKYLVHVSFDPTTRPLKVDKPKNYIDVTFEEGGYIKKIEVAVVRD